jgi:hypothetical protein
LEQMQERRDIFSGKIKNLFPTRKTGEAHPRILREPSLDSSRHPSGGGSPQFVCILCS